MNFLICIHIFYFLFIKFISNSNGKKTSLSLTKCAFCIQQLLVALVSAYRYEGPCVHEATAKSEAKILHNAIKNAKQNPIEDDKVIMLLSTRSKPHLKAVYKYYKELSGNFLDQVGLHTYYIH